MLLAGTAACSSSMEASPGIAVSTPDIASGQQDFSTAISRDYPLRPSDIISIMVFREEGLSMPQVAVSADGQISFPLVGSLTVAGMSPASVEQRLEELLEARYLREADVTVNVLDYTSHQVTVEGAVQEPGVYQFLPGTRLSGGVALANGLDRVAEPQQVAVFRQTESGMQIAKFDYAAVSSGAMLDPVLLPGDRIVIGVDGLEQFWQDFLKALPAFGLFTNI